MNAEHAVLGAILQSNSVYRDAAQHITGNDFQDPRLGAVFDGLGQVINRGETVDAVTVELYFPDWGVRGVSSADPWQWTDAALHPQVAGQAAQVVRADSIRRNGAAVLRHAVGELADNANDPVQVLEDMKRRLVREERTELSSVTLNDVLLTPDDQDWIVPDLLERKDRLILTGHEGLGKTTLVRQMLLLPAAGIHPFTFRPMEPITALVVDAENTAKQWMRATRWMVKQAQRSGGDPGHRIHMSLSGRLNLLDPVILGDVHRLIDKHDPHIVFIGPLYRLALQMNTDEQIAPVIAALDSIRDRGVALVIEAHAGHAVGVNGVRDVRPRGSSALLGWPEFGYGIRKDVSEGADPAVFDLVAWRGARESREWPLQLRRGDWEAGEWPWMPV